MLVRHFTLLGVAFVAAPATLVPAMASARVPDGFALSAARPDPAGGRAEVTFSLSDEADVRLAVYDALGREVAVLADGAYEAGGHAATFEGGALAPGVYLVRLVTETAAGAEVLTRRLTIAR